MSINRSILATYGASIWTTFINLTFVPIYISYLGIESYGLIGFMLTFQAWLFLFDLGLSSTLNRQMAKYSAGAFSYESIINFIKSIELIYACLGVFTLAVSFSMAPIIVHHWFFSNSGSQKMLTTTVSLMGLVLLTQWMGTLYRNALLGLHCQMVLSLSNSLFTTLRAAGALLALIYISPSITSFLVIYCIINTIESIVLYYYLNRKIFRIKTSINFRFKLTREIISYSASLAVMGLLATILTQVDKLLLAQFLSLEEFGYFSLAFTVANIVILAILPIYTIAYPKMSQLVAAGDQSEVVVQYHFFSQLASIAIFPLSILVCLFSNTIIYVWTGNYLVAASVAPTLTIWVIGTALNGLIHIPYATQLAHGWPRLFVSLNIIAVCIVTPLIFYYIPKYGAFAAAWIWVGTNIGYIIFGTIFMHARILRQEMHGWCFYDVGVPLSLCITTGFVLLGFEEFFTTRIAQFWFLVTAGLALLLATSLGTSLGRKKIGLLFVSLLNSTPENN